VDLAPIVTAAEGEAGDGGAGLPSPAPVTAAGGRWPPLRRPWIPHPSPPPEERPRMGCGAALTCARRCHRWWPLACSPAAMDPAPRHHRHRRRGGDGGRATLTCARRHWWPLACSSRRPLAVRVVGEDHPEAPLVAPPPPTVFASGRGACGMSGIGRAVTGKSGCRKAAVGKGIRSMVGPTV
jgi:hypothetical protein